MKFLLWLAFACTLSTSSIAGWTVETRTDSMTDEVNKSADVVNQQGHSLAIYRRSNGSVWLNFRLSTKSFDQLAAEQTLEFRVDKFKSHTIPMSAALEIQLNSLGLQLYSWEPKWVNFLIWDGKEQNGRGEMLNHLMQGSKVVFRYYLFTGGYKETSFPLNGAASAITAALNLGERLPPEQENALRDYGKAKTDAMTACASKRSTFGECIDRVTACGKQYPDNIAEFQRCAK